MGQGKGQTEMEEGKRLDIKRRITVISRRGGGEKGLGVSLFAPPPPLYYSVAEGAFAVSARKEEGARIIMGGQGLCNALHCQDADTVDAVLGVAMGPLVLGLAGWKEGRGLPPLSVQAQSQQWIGNNSAMTFSVKRRGTLEERSAE